MANLPGTAVKAGGKAARFGLPLLGAMMGAVGGIATGDLGNVAKYAATGAATGETLGRNADRQAKRLGGRIKGPSAVSEFKKEYNSKKYLDEEKEIKKQQNIAFNNNKDIYERRGVLDDEDMKLANDICVRYGITDPYQIMAVAEMARDNAGNKEDNKDDDAAILEEQIQNAIVMKKLADREGDAIDTPKHSDWIEQYRKELREKGVPEDKIDEGIRMMEYGMRDYNSRMKEMNEEKEYNDMY